MRSRTLLALGIFGVLALASPRAHAELIERVLADVDARPVLLSEVQLLERLRGLDRKAALEATIDTRLMYREAARVPQAALSEAEAERACRSLRERAGVIAQQLENVQLCALAEREGVVLKYVDLRFGPQFTASGGTAEDAAKRLDQRIEAWVQELRAAAQIRYNPD